MDLNKYESTALGFVLGMFVIGITTALTLGVYQTGRTNQEAIRAGLVQESCGNWVLPNPIRFDAEEATK